MSTFGGKADMPFCTANVCFDPKRTSRHRLGLANYYSSRRQFLRAEQSGIALLALSNFRRPAVTNVGVVGSILDCGVGAPAIGLQSGVARLSEEFPSWECFSCV